MIPIEQVKLIVDTYIALEKELSSGDIDKKKLCKKNPRNIQVLEKLSMKQEGI